MTRANTETAARDTAQDHGWIVSTRHDARYSTVRYQRGERRLSAVYGPSGRIIDYTVYRGDRISRSYGRHDAAKRDGLLALLVQVGQ